MQRIIWSVFSVILLTNPDRPGAAYGYVDMGGWVGGKRNTSWRRTPILTCSHSPTRIKPWPKSLI
jgi:hypothetical protein